MSKTSKTTKNKNLFFMVMEAEGDELQAFDPGASDAAPDDVAPPATETDDTTSSSAMDDNPPEMNDDTMDLSTDMSDSSSDMGGIESGDDYGSNDSSSNNEDEEADKKDTKLSDKANNILNQQLYQKMVDRNTEIEEIINSIKSITPLLPYDVIKQNDESVNNLSSALLKGKNYAINEFVDSGYGENLLFFQKLDSLYTLLLDKINKNLKKIQ